MKPHTINKTIHFIAGWYINKNVCTDLIKYFENSPDYEQTFLYRKEGVLFLKKGKVGIPRAVRKEVETG